jgi:hypothetical protein
MELTVNVPTHRHGTSHLLNVGLLGQDLLSLQTRGRGMLRVGRGWSSGIREKNPSPDIYTQGLFITKFGFNHD